MSRNSKHETTDVNTRGLFWLGFAAFPAAAAMLIFIALVFIPNRHPAVPAHEIPPAPRLQENPHVDLTDFLAKENELLKSYGWVDRKAGKVRIPIERAMKLIENRPSGRFPSSVGGVSKVGWDPHPGAKLPMGAPFIDETGHETTLRDALGGLPGLLVFSYSRCPNLCGLVSQGMIDTVSSLPGVPGRDYRVISVSIDPRESPRLALMRQRTLLAKLAGAKPAQDAWRMLTGTEPAIAGLAGAAGFHFERDPASGEYAHPSGFIVLTPDGVASRYFFGIRYQAAAVESALAQARRGLSESVRSSPSLAEGFLLFCFHYDPEKSSRGPLILGIVRVVGALSALALLGFLIRLGTAP